MINKKHTIKYYLLLLMLILPTMAMLSQVQTNPPMRQVLSSTGGSGTFASGTMDYTLGEPMVQTFTPGSPFTVKTLTQGFQQPDLSALSIHQVSVNSTCIGANNGSISLVVLSSTGTVRYTWAFPLVDTTANLNNLQPGTYHYTATDGTFTINDSVSISEDQVKCEAPLKFYTGITPNGDGNNDFWYVTGITDYPDNVVSIFNRWGNMVWSQAGYNNVDVVWDGHNNNTVALPDGTYFYVITAGNRTYKGWVELTR